MTYIIIGLVLAGGFIFYLTSCQNKSNTQTKQIDTDKDTTSPKEYHTNSNSYDDLRAIALGVTPEQLQLSLPTDKTVVYGVVMDWEMGGAIATIVSYQTGDASLYLSSGGGVIGGGKHQEVNSAARKFVSIAQTYLDKAAKTDATDIPITNQIKFYLLTNKGNFYGEENMKNFENNSSEWLKLFEEGNNVLTQLRIVSEKK